jgi:hypothetical protein
MSTDILVSDGQIASYQKYRFRIIAVNAFGSSYASPELVLSVAPLPSQPALLTKDQSLSSKTSITIKWNSLPDTEPASGYILYMADMKAGG